MNCTGRLKIRLWLQRPPKVQWVLRVIYETDRGTAIVRTWFNEYAPSNHPPPLVTMPAAIACANLARAALAGSVEDRNYTVESK